MIPGRVKRRRTSARRSIVAIAAIGLCVATVSAQEFDSSAMTQVPHLARFARNKEIAQSFARLAEFSIRLLQWRDTDRQPVIDLQKRMKREGYQQTALGSGQYEISSVAAAALVREGYSSLRSPSLVRVAIGETLSVRQSVAAVTLLRGVVYPLPVILESRATVGSDATLVQISSPVSEYVLPITLKAGHSEGVFLPLLATSTKTTSIEVKIASGERSRFVRLKVRTVEPARLTVRVLDGKRALTAARVSIVGVDGRSYTPTNVQPRVTNADYGQPYGGDFYFYTAGDFSLLLPPGSARMEVLKGLQFSPLIDEVEVSASAHVFYDAIMEKPDYMQFRDWFSGDIHVHANIYNDRLIRPRDALLIAKAEDLNVTNLLICNDVAEHVNDRQFFEGRPNDLSEENYILYWNEELRARSVNNHVAFLGLKRLVEPIFVGWPGTPHSYDSPANYHMALEARAQGAAVTYVHPGLPGQYPVDIALGAAETIDVLCQRNEDVNTRHWYHLLNCGFRCAASAGTDSFMNVPYHLVPGAGRVYVRSGGPLTYRSWLEAYRRGYSFVTNGPLVRFTVNDRGPGEEIRSPDGSIELDIEAEAVSYVPMQKLELVVNGRVVAMARASGRGTRIEMDERIRIADSAWIAVRVRGAAHRWVLNDTSVYAHTSPVYCYLAGRKIRSRQSAQFFVKQIDRLVETTRASENFADPGDKEKMIRLFRQGQDIYREMAH